MEQVRTRSMKARVVRGIQAVTGLVLGLVAGFYVTVAIFVVKARFGHYIFAVHDVTEARIEALPIILFGVTGMAVGWNNARALRPAGVWGLLLALALVPAGAVLGGWAWGAPEGRWAGGIVASALGLIVGAVIGSRKSVARASARRPVSPVGALMRMITFPMLMLSALSACEGSAMFGALPDLPESEPVPMPDPSQVDAVVFIIGDGGATDADKTPLLKALTADVERWSTALARDSAVSVVYPGDIVYPVGVRDRSHPAFPRDSTRLWNQIDLVRGPSAREHATVGLFLAGNHDWGNRTGEAGLSRLMNLQEQLEIGRQAGAHVSLHPPPGSPGPAIRDLRRNVRLVFLDTHWFLQSRSHAEKQAFFDRVEDAIRTAGDRHVIMFAHHPYYSAGPHGDVLPGPESLGIQYLLKKSGTLVQDLNSPVYKELLAGLKAVFRETGTPPLVFAGGHDHSLQVLAGQDQHDPVHVLVSGAGSKVSSITQAEGIRYGAAKPGYMMLAFRKDDAVDLFVVAGDRERITCAGILVDVDACMAHGIRAFEVVHSETLLYPPADDRRDDQDDSPDAPLLVPADTRGDDGLPSDELREVEPPIPAVVPRALHFGSDSVRARPGEVYPAGWLKRLVFGDMNRHLWEIEFDVPILDLDAVGGGLEVDELSGGKQTLGLRFRGRDGRLYQFRSIVKNAGRALPDPLEETPVDRAMQDQMAAQFPLAAMVVAELLDAAGILVAKPRPVVMPDDPRLGPYRDLVAGRMGWIEERPNEEGDDRPGFAGSTKITGSEELYEELREDPKSYVDARKLVRARLIDMLVGDWDRHSDQWRWASFPDGDRTRWEPIPRDRDWAFARMDGLLHQLAPFLLPRYVGFSEDYPPVKRLAASGYRVDHTLLATLERDDFLQAALTLQDVLTDSVLASAVAVLPPEYKRVEGERLVTAMKKRRDALLPLANRYFEAVSETVHLRGVENYRDEISIVRTADDRLHVRVVGEDGIARIDRILDPAVTREIRLYVNRDEDRLRIPERDRLPVRLTFAEEDDEERDY